MAVLSLRALTLMLIAVPGMAMAGELKIDRLEVVYGQAEVVDAGVIDVYTATGVSRIGLSRPAPSASDLRYQLTMAVRVQCLIFGDTASASCLGIDAFGSKWKLGGNP